MSNTDRDLIAELRVMLTRQQNSPVVVGNYCAYARWFLDHLARRNIAVADVSEAQVAQYLRHAIALFRKRHGRPPGPYWHSIPRSGIHALLRLAQLYKIHLQLLPFSLHFTAHTLDILILRNSCPLLCG